MAFHFHRCVSDMRLGAPQCFKTRGAPTLTAPRCLWALAEESNFNITLKYPANFPVSFCLPDTTFLSLYRAKQDTCKQRMWDVSFASKSNS